MIMSAAGFCLTRLVSGQMILIDRWDAALGLQGHRGLDVAGPVLRQAATYPQHGHRRIGARRPTDGGSAASRTSDGNLRGRSNGHPSAERLKVSVVPPEVPRVPIRTVLPVHAARTRSACGTAGFAHAQPPLCQALDPGSVVRVRGCATGWTCCMSDRRQLQLWRSAATSWSVACCTLSPK